MFNISEFIANINQGGVAKTSYFDVLISRNKGNQNSNLRELIIRTDSVSLPGRRIRIEDWNINGLPVRAPAGSEFNELSMSIYLSEDWREKLFFEQWADEMVGNYRNSQSQTMFDVGYADDLYGQITINCYSATGDVVYKVQCVDALLSGIQDNSMTWEDEAIAKLKISFLFRYYNNKMQTGQDPY